MINAIIKGMVLSKRIKEGSSEFKTDPKTIIEVLQMPTDDNERSFKFDMKSDDLNLKVEPMKSYVFETVVIPWNNNGRSGVSIKIISFKEDAQGVKLKNAS
jgi:hypothetical protein